MKLFIHKISDKRCHYVVLINKGLEKIIQSLPCRCLHLTEFKHKLWHCQAPSSWGPRSMSALRTYTNAELNLTRSCYTIYSRTIPKRYSPMQSSCHILICNNNITNCRDLSTQTASSHA